MPSRLASDLSEFRQLFNRAKHIVALTGAGISAESGVPTFRGAGGYWRRYESTRLATPEAFRADPSLVWEFYHYRRELVLSKSPNAAHLALARAEEELKAAGRQLVVITQNVDGLHERAGSKNLVELHGNLYKVRCTGCGEVSDNHSSPICAALAGKGAPDPDAKDARIPVEKLPRCQSCDALLRPHIVWFGENLDQLVLEKAQMHLDMCDLCLVVGTSSTVYPAAMFAPQLAARGVVIGEFNLEETPVTNKFRYYFKGSAGETVPKVVLND